jgi:hypothetical protein
MCVFSLVEDQTPRSQPLSQLCLDLFGLLPGMAAGDHIVGVSHHNRGARLCHADVNAGAVVADPRGFLQPM